MYLTKNQEYLLSILAETHFLKREQAHLLLRLQEEWKTPEQTDAALRQLRYMGRIVYLTDDVVALADHRKDPLDLEMLQAVDVMLDLAKCELVRISAHKPPFKLCFLAAQSNAGLGNFAIMPVSPGQENAVSAQVQFTEADRRTIIFLLSNWAQHEGVYTNLPHYFMVPDNGKRRYFKGVVAGQ